MEYLSNFFGKSFKYARFFVPRLHSIYNISLLKFLMLKHMAENEKEMVQMSKSGWNIQGHCTKISKNNSCSISEENYSEELKLNMSFLYLAKNWLWNLLASSWNLYFLEQGLVAKCIPRNTFARWKKMSSFSSAVTFFPVHSFFLLRLSYHLIRISTLIGKT